MGLGGQRQDWADLPPEKTRYLLYRELVGPQGRYGRTPKISSPPAFDPRTFPAVVRHYTDWAIPTHIIKEYGVITKGSYTNALLDNSYS
jgi:hypothetical protein